MNNLKATIRDKTSTGFNNRLRAEGNIPAILYGGKNPNQNISVRKKDLQNIINTESFLSKVIELEVNGKKEKVIPREVTYHVVSDEPMHIDFLRIVTGSKIVLEIPVKFINQSESPGLKRGGVLNIVRRKIELDCPADKIPDELIIDLKGTDIGTSLKISQVKLPENVLPTIRDRDFVIATVAAPTIIKEPEKPAEGEAVEGADAEGATATGDAATEGEKSKEAEASKKDEKGKDSPGDKKGAADKKQPEKKPPEKK